MSQITAKQVMDSWITTLENKQKEYAEEDDQFKNFKMVASMGYELLNPKIPDHLKPAAISIIFMLKQVAGQIVMLAGNKTGTEPITSKFADTGIYSALTSAMYQEALGGDRPYVEEERKHKLTKETEENRPYNIEITDAGIRLS